MTMRMFDLMELGLGYRQMMAPIGESANEASTRLHTRLGFRTLGHEIAVGLKFGRWVDVVAMQLAPGEGANSGPATVLAAG